MNKIEKDKLIDLKIQELSQINDSLNSLFSQIRALKTHGESFKTHEKGARILELTDVLNESITLLFNSSTDESEVHSFKKELKILLHNETDTLSNIEPCVKLLFLMQV
ncbi:MAG: hypothetical protein H0U75_06610 [Legionella sp.]|nr:hypothetical protein [Legionella sp.]